MADDAVEKMAAAHRKYLDLQKRRAAARRAEKEAQGLVQSNVWIPKNHASLMRKIAYILRENSDPNKEFILCMRTKGSLEKWKNMCDNSSSPS